MAPHRPKQTWKARSLWEDGHPELSLLRCVVDVPLQDDPAHDTDEDGPLDSAAHLADGGTPVNTVWPAHGPSDRPLSCPLCGQHNEAGAGVCASCGGRLRARTAFDGLPEQRKTVTWAVALAVVVAIGLGAALWISRLGGSTGSRTDSGAAPVTTSVTAPVATVDGADAEPALLTPIRISASSEADGFHADHLIDGEASSYWADNGVSGVDVVLTIEFAEPVAVLTMEVINIPRQAFGQYHRISGFTVQLGSGAARIAVQLEDDVEAQQVQLPYTEITELSLVVTGTYPPSFDPHVDAVALGELRFFGELPSQ